MMVESYDLALIKVMILAETLIQYPLRPDLGGPHLK